MVLQFPLKPIFRTLSRIYDGASLQTAVFAKHLYKRRLTRSWIRFYCIFGQTSCFCVFKINMAMINIFFLSFTSIHDSQDNRGRGRLSLLLLSTTSRCFTDTSSFVKCSTLAKDFTLVAREGLAIEQRYNQIWTNCTVGWSGIHKSGSHKYAHVCKCC